MILSAPWCGVKKMPRAPGALPSRWHEPIVARGERGDEFVDALATGHELHESFRGVPEAPGDPAVALDRLLIAPDAKVSPRNSGDDLAGNARDVGRRANSSSRRLGWRSLRDSNPCFSLERAAS